MLEALLAVGSQMAAEFSNFLAASISKAGSRDVRRFSSHMSLFLLHVYGLTQEDLILLIAVGYSENIALSASHKKLMLPSVARCCHLHLIKKS